jgi:hypothetical protein
MFGFLGSAGSASSFGVIALQAIPIVGAIIGIVAGLFSIFGGGPDLSKIVKAINDLGRQTAEGLDTLKRFSWTIGRFALGGLLLLDRVIHDMVGELVKGFRSILDALKKVYEDVIKPALKALRNIRKILDDVYRKWLRPIINAIQQIRRILAIFRAFGFKWAGALDARLARIEGKIIAPYIWLVRQMNGYGSWINVILTARGVIQKPLFMNSAFANIGGLTNLWWVSQSGGLTGTTPPQAVTATPSPTLPQVQGMFSQYVTTDTGRYADVATRARATFQAIDPQV